MSRARDQAALLRAQRFLSELKTINPQMTLTEAIILLDVAANEGGPADEAGQPTIGLPMRVIQQKHFPNNSRQLVSRTMRTLQTGFDVRGKGDGIEMVEVFSPSQATSKRTRSVRLRPVARGHILEAVRKVFPTNKGNPEYEYQIDQASEDQIPQAKEG